MTSCIETDHSLFLNDKNRINAPKKIFYKRWWYRHYKHQNFICEIIEHNLFYKTTLVLLILDCLFVLTQAIIDFTKVKSECLQKKNSFISKSEHKIEIIMKVLHYMSITILTFFVLEFIIKIYVFGKEFWNIHKRKMEYFDAFIVIFSYFIDIYFLQNEKNYFMEYRFQMLTTIRMWRIVRLINGIVQFVINEEQKKKDRLNTKYVATIEQFLDLLKYKTNYIVNGYKNIDECFNQIDNQCQDFFNLYQETNQQETLSTAITQFSGQLQTLNTSISNSDFSIVLKN